MRATIGLPNGNVAVLRTPAEVKQRMADIAKMCIRLEILNLTTSKEYLTLYAQYGLLYWYVNQGLVIRKLACYNWWMFGAIPDIAEPEYSPAWTDGCVIALEWLLTRDAAGLIADSLPVQQSF